MLSDSLVDGQWLYAQGQTTNEILFNSQNNFRY